MQDVEKMISDMNKITEADYKQNHIFMWEFIINRIKDASLVCSDKKDIILVEVKEEYLEKVKARLEEKEFLNAKDTFTLEKINKGLLNDCWACQYVKDKYCCASCSDKCPLLEDNKGKLRYKCTFWYSDFVLLKVALQEDHDYEKALKLATGIKEAWRDVK